MVSKTNATPDKNALSDFVMVAQTGGFQSAAERLGVTRSAVSQSIRKLENQLGITLVNRTTRSVSLTEAGEALYLRIAPALGEVNQAVEDVLESNRLPRGRLRLAVSSIAERFISGELFASFMQAYPEVGLDITITDDEFDIVANHFDAGVRLGEVIEQDMIAVPVSAPQRQVTVATPDYLERFGTPQHPQELLEHRCIGWRPAPDSAPYRWEYAENGREFDLAVPASLTTNDMGLMIRTTLAGGGISFGMEETYRPYIDAGQLVTLLEDYLPGFPGFYLYFPSRHNLAPKLRALIEHVKYRAG
ncbi:LysR family transcriptional regulator [Pokkaliibacter sp. CJK22405]|uniref:LysR family transcriptional regulator n=1 Tax=Pokkaliibacter sp. CJK22405 TaxID=3384615 RepID=UPI00398564D1